jgi:cytochrome c
MFMRLGPFLAAAALATLVSACNKPQPAAPAAPEQPAAPALSDAEKQQLLTALPAPYNTADLANGQAKFALCQSCHTIAEGGANMTGPNLHGIFGRKAASLPDYKYSDALKAAGWIWEPTHLDQWVANPQTFLPGTKMTFAGLKDEKDRTDLIAYVMIESGYKPK